MLEKKYPIFPGTEYTENGQWSSSTSTSGWINDKMHNLTMYDNYSEQHNNDSANYEVEWDWKGP